MTEQSVRHEEIPLVNLDLDRDNPRHGPVVDSSEAISRLILDQRERLVRIAVDIHEHGLSPAMLFIVTPSTDGRFTVLEGNRRLAALRILDDPNLLPDELRSPAFSKAAAEPGGRPTAVMCAVVPNRDEARLWLDRIHSGQLGGIGTIPWSSVAKYRFDPKPLSRGHTANAINVLDWLRLRLDPDDPERTVLDTVEGNSVTNLGRLAGDPHVRRLIGFDFDSGTVAPNDEASAVIRRLLIIINDLANGTTVTDLKKKRDRFRHVTKLLEDDVYESPDSDQLEDQDDQEDATNDSSDTSSSTADAAGAEDKSGKRKPSQTAAHPFDKIEIKALHPRIQQLVVETIKLNAEKFPNSIAVLLRAIVELSVTEYLVCRGITPSRGQKLSTRIRKAMELLGIPNDDPAFQPLVTKLNEQHSIISVPNLHQYVHNPNAVPGKSDLYSIAFAYRPLLERICSDLSEQQSTAT